MPTVSNVDGSDSKVRDIREWLQRYAKFSHRLFKSGRAVEDQLQSPMFSSADIEMQGPADAATANSSSGTVFERTGFVCRSIIWKEEANQAESEPLTTGGSEVIGKFTFLSDWERLWNFLADEDSDEIAVQLPFLRAAIEFVFHRRIVQMMYILFVWNVSLFSILIARYERNSRGLTGANFLDATFELSIYLLVHILFKGTEAIRPSNVFFSSKTRKAKDGNDAAPAAMPASLEDQETAQEAVDEEFPISSTLRRLWRRGKRELRFIFAAGDEQAGVPRARDTKTRKRDKRQSLFFYRWINMALKILTRDYGLDLTKINFNRRSYRFTVFFAVVLFPIYCTINGYVQYVTAIRIACSAQGESIEEHSCGFYTFQFIFSGFGLSFVLIQSIYGTCIILALASLAYGGEIAFRLAECWTLKYHSLRRVEVQVDEPTAALATAVNASASANTPGATVVHHRRRASMAQIPSEDTLILPMDAQKMKALLSRDASEHYLFICELLRRASELWSPILTLFIFLALYVCLADVIYVVAIVGTANTLTSTVLIIRLSIYVFIRVVVLFFYPILSFAFANSYFIKMNDIFRVADTSDFALIGGRDRWLRIFTESPAAWTFFGVSVTPSRLFAVLWTSLVALGGLFLSSIISSSSR